jgi:membrane fusion protein (multidrug efflux system)
MEPQLETPKKKKTSLIIFAVIAILLAGYGAMKLVHSMTHESTDNAQIESNAVPIVSRLAGYIDSLGIGDYVEVKAGQPLVTIDSREYELAVKQSEADLLSAKADLANAQAQLVNSNLNRNVAQANLDVQKVRTDKAQADYVRDQNLFKDNSITRKQLEDSKANTETAQKQLRSNTDQVSFAVSQINNAQAQIEKMRAQVETKQAALENAELKLSYTRMTSPVSGKIGKTNLQKGQYVQPGQTLFTVVNNEQYWIIANFKETQLEKIKEGMPAEISLDGYPDVKVKATITSVSDATGARFALLPPDNATGNFVKVTQRVPVKLTIDNMAEVKQYLKAGLSVTVDIKTN